VSDLIGWIVAKDGRVLRQGWRALLHVGRTDIWLAPEEFDPKDRSMFPKGPAFYDEAMAKSRALELGAEAHACRLANPEDVS
jgi:hypothetical protein